VVVIEKPIGVVAHQGSGHTASDTVANWFVTQHPKAAVVGGDPMRPGIVHRLDRDVSGVMVLAKTQEMYDALVDQFTRGVVQKEYTAIVYGRMDQPHGVINFPLVRSTSKAKMAAKPSSEQRAKDDERGEDERDAVTEFETMDARQHYSVVKAIPKTGRMHQIRAHLAAIDHAIVGDTLYAPKNHHPKQEERLYLHASTLTIADANGQARTFSSATPTSFAAFLASHQ
ncbi:MAG: RNA pseudouridine synthase, partial [Candidatus Diapherotrites archaeon]|nr:RNA pseudouridine synthase [Candidatus Diapherotrites archaeon]